MTYRTAAVLILPSLAPNVSHAQVDSFGGSPIKPWGIWRPLSPKSPYLESRSIRTSSLTGFLPPTWRKLERATSSRGGRLLDAKSPLFLA